MLTQNGLVPYWRMLECIITRCTEYMYTPLYLHHFFLLCRLVKRLQVCNSRAGPKPKTIKKIAPSTAKVATSVSSVKVTKSANSLSSEESDHDNESVNNPNNCGDRIFNFANSIDDSVHECQQLPSSESQQRPSSSPMQPPRNSPSSVQPLSSSTQEQLPYSSQIQEQTSSQQPLQSTSAQVQTPTRSTGSSSQSLSQSSPPSSVVCCSVSSMPPLMDVSLLETIESRTSVK